MASVRTKSGQLVGMFCSRLVASFVIRDGSCVVLQRRDVSKVFTSKDPEAVQV